MDTENKISCEFMTTFLMNNKDIHAACVKHLKAHKGQSSMYKTVKDIVDDLVYSIDELGSDCCFSHEKFANSVEVKPGLWFNLDYAYDEIAECI